MSGERQAKKNKPDLPGGFRDYGPREARMKQWILDTARKTFESFGFEPIETSAVQRTQVLTGGEEDSEKLIFNVKGSEEKISNTSLRFDLTVPLARFIAAHADIPKPFRRYEIGRVWRAERQQAGRYREFTQADVDIVGSTSPDADAETVAVIYTTLKNLNVEEFVIKMNDRTLLNQLPNYAGFPEEKLWTTLRIVDKKDKIGASGVRNELQKEFGSSAAERIGEFFENESPESKNLAAIVEILKRMGIDKKYWSIDRVMVRGLSYYTGPIFEAVLPALPEIGSVFGGGRYDNLVMNFTGQKIPAVGASLGVDRLIVALEKLGKVRATGATAQILILNLAEELKPEYLKFARELRGAGNNTALYLGDERTFQAQLAYAVKKEIPYVIIYGGEEKEKGVVTVKNLVDRKQEEVPREKVVAYFAK